MIHDFVKRQFVISSDKPSSLIQGKPAAGASFLLCGSVFIAFKVKETDDVESTGGIFSCLDSALKSWRPNLLQLLISEIQNNLEQKSYASIQDFMPTDALKIGWLYHTLINKQDSSLSLFYKLLDSIKNAMSQDLLNKESAFYQFSEKTTEFTFAGLLTENSDNFEMAKKGAKIESEIRKEHVIHELNNYLASDDFIGDFPTTGTILYSEDDQGIKSWYLCVSPACDMEQHASPTKSSWQHELNPFRPMNIIKIEEIGFGKEKDSDKEKEQKEALKNAEHGHHIFIVLNGERYCFRVAQSNANAVRIRTVFLSDTKEKELETNQFRIDYIRKIEDGISLGQMIFHAVRQLRPEYAIRFLQFAGAQQSRVGVDFINLPKESKK